MTLSNADIQGSRQGDWNTTPRSGPGPEISLSSTTPPPPVGGSTPAAIDSTVDFPQPECPIRQTNSPLAIAKSKSRTITASPPLGFGYTLVRCEISRYFRSLLTPPPPCRTRAGAPPPARARTHLPGRSGRRSIQHRHAVALVPADIR